MKKQISPRRTAKAAEAPCGQSTAGPEGGRAEQDILTGVPAAFAAANSARGFVSYYREIFDTAGLRHLYILKGGPGTGKSRFLSELAQAALARGACAELFYCSSDPQSLDGVLIRGGAAGEGGIGILDGTAPHSMEADPPGAVCDLLDLGQFWNSHALEAKRQEIETLGKAKAAAFSHAYRYLSAAGQAAAVLAEEIGQILRQEKLETAVRSLFNRAIGDGRSGAPSCQTRIATAYTMSGYTVFDNLWKEVGSRIAVTDEYGAGANGLEVVLQEAKNRGHRILLSLCPLTLRPDAVILPEADIAFVRQALLTAGSWERVLNMRRFLPAAAVSDRRAVLRQAQKLQEQSVEAALSQLREAGKSHFALERLYGKAMDFPQKEVWCRETTDRIFADK